MCSSAYPAKAEWLTYTYKRWPECHLAFAAADEEAFEDNSEVHKKRSGRIWYVDFICWSLRNQCWTCFFFDECGSKGVRVSVISAVFFWRTVFLLLERGKKQPLYELYRSIKWLNHLSSSLCLYTYSYLSYYDLLVSLSFFVCGERIFSLFFVAYSY